MGVISTNLVLELSLLLSLFAVPIRTQLLMYPGPVLFIHTRGRVSRRYNQIGVHIFVYELV